VANDGGIRQAAAMSSFFEPIPMGDPVPGEPARRDWSPPLWDRPSEGTMPVVIGVSRLFNRTDDVAMALDHVKVYPNGFELVVTTHVSPHLPPDLMRGVGVSTVMLRAGSARPPDASGEIGAPRFVRGSAMPPRVGVEFSDGRRAGHQAGHGMGIETDEAGIPVDPVIAMRGGGGHGSQFHWEHWVFPLPPSGPVEVFAEWATAGLSETSLLIDGDELRDAAANAIELWS
jgi:hypothetical protein